MRITYLPSHHFTHQPGHLSIHPPTNPLTYQSTNPSTLPPNHEPTRLLYPLTHSIHPPLFHSYDLISGHVFHCRSIFAKDHACNSIASTCSTCQCKPACIAGIVVGLAVLLLIVVVGGVLISRKISRQKSLLEVPQSEPPDHDVIDTAIGNDPPVPQNESSCVVTVIRCEPNIDVEEPGKASGMSVL